MSLIRLLYDSVFETAVAETNPFGNHKKRPHTFVHIIDYLTHSALKHTYFKRF